MQRLENLGFLGEVFRFLGYLKEFKGFETFIFLFFRFYCSFSVQRRPDIYDIVRTKEHLIGGGLPHSLCHIVFYKLLQYSQITIN